MSARQLPAFLKPINTHPTLLCEGQNGKLYGSGPDPLLPPRNKREGVGYARRERLASLAQLRHNTSKEVKGRLCETRRSHDIDKIVML